MLIISRKFFWNRYKRSAQSWHPPSSFTVKNGIIIPSGHISLFNYAMSYVPFEMQEEPW